MSISYFVTVHINFLFWNIIYMVPSRENNQNASHPSLFLERKSRAKTTQKEYQYLPEKISVKYCSKNELKNINEWDEYGSHIF
jgi:hypothetical protein